MILRDSRLYEIKNDFTKMQISKALEGKAIRFFLPLFLEKHHIAVINLLKDIQGSNPEIYLTLKNKLRGLGLYNEEFSIQSMIYRQAEDEASHSGKASDTIVKYKQLDKNDIVRLI